MYSWETQTYDSRAGNHWAAGTISESSRSKSQLSAFDLNLLALLAQSLSTSLLLSNFDMSMKYYYIHVGLQARDTFFGDPKQIYPCSSNLKDKFPAKVLLEAEKRYGNYLARENVDKLSIL